MVLQKIRVLQNFSQISQVSHLEFFATPSWSLDLFSKAAKVSLSSRKVSDLPFATLKKQAKHLPWQLYKPN